MNAAFAIGRLCDMDTGRRRLLGLPESEKMVIYYNLYHFMFSVFITLIPLPFQVIINSCTVLY